MFVGNIDKTISLEELKKYFYDNFTSILSVKLIMGTNSKSKGYGFIEFANYKEFQKALNKKEPVYLGKQRLVFNSAKNRFDDFEDEIYQNLNQNQNFTQFNEVNSMPGVIPNQDLSDINKANNFNSLLNLNLNSEKNENRSSIGSKSTCYSFLGENTKPQVELFEKIEKNLVPESIINYQIINALKEIEINSSYFNQSKACMYYCVGNALRDRTLSENFIGSTS